MSNMSRYLGTKKIMKTLQSQFRIEKHKTSRKFSIISHVERISKISKKYYYLSPSANLCNIHISEVKDEIRDKTRGFSTLSLSSVVLFLFTISYASSWQPSLIMLGNEIVGPTSGAN